MTTPKTPTDRTLEVEEAASKMVDAVESIVGLSEIESERVADELTALLHQAIEEAEIQTLESVLSSGVSDDAYDYAEQRLSELTTHLKSKEEL